MVSAHREENIESDTNFNKLVAVLNAVAEDHGLPVIVFDAPAHAEAGRRNRPKFHPLVRLLKPLGFLDYVTSCNCRPRRCCPTAARSTRSRRS